MTKRAAAIVTAGLAATTLTGIALPAHAADWTYIGEYPTKSKCIDMGQSYQREGWDKYSCRTNVQGTWYLFVK
ncbi:hypothetical protein [Kribbella sp. NPDC055071]